MNESKYPVSYPPSLALPVRRQPPSRNVFAAPPQAGPESDTVSSAWHSIQRGKWLILACIAGAMLLAIVISGFQTPMYRATTILELRDPGRTISPFTPARAATDAATDNAIVTEVTLLHSEPLLRDVVQKMGLDKQARFTSGRDSAQMIWHTLRREDLPAETPLEKAVGVANHNLSIRHEARIINVSYSSPDPKLAADFVNTLASEHMNRAFTSDEATTKELREYLDRETAELNDKLAASEVEMQRYAQNSGIVQTDSQDTVTQQQLRLLSEELGKAEADRMMKESRNQVAANASPDVMTQLIDDPALKSYQSKLTDLEQQSQKLQSMYQPKSYKVQEVEQQIKVLKEAIANETKEVRERAQNEFRAASAREAMLKQKFDAESQHVSAQQAKFIHYGTLQKQLETTRALHAQLLEKAQELALAAVAPNTDLKIVANATPPVRPYTPNYPLNLSLGLFIGLFAGVIAAVSRDQVRPRLRAPGDASTLLQLPELAAVPSIDRRRDAQYLLPPPSGGRLDDRLELAAWNGTPTLLIESIHDALASIMTSCDRGCRVLLFTSPNPGDGKTTITANLAISLALCRRKVLLIDGDLRRPRLNQIFNVPLEPGLADALRDADPKENPQPEQIHTLPVPSLSLMTAGKLSTSYAPLFGGNRLGHLLGRMRNQFEVILIDAPPVLHGPDARLLGRLCDAAVLITRARKTTRQDAVAAASRLAADRIPLAGTILNDWNPRSDSSAYSSYLPSEPEVETAVP
jgi:capsular exopolysaccharide synthesis family protein